MNEAPPSPQERLAAALRGVGSEEYGPSYRDHLLEIYKVYLEMADRISDMVTGETRDEVDSLIDGGETCPPDRVPVFS